MNGPSSHPSRRALLPGALLAMLVTAGALVALAVVAGVNRGGPGRLWLGGSDGAVSLDGRDGTSVIGGRERRGNGPAALPVAGSPVALLPGAGARLVGPAAATAVLDAPRGRVEAAAARRLGTRRRGG